MLSRLGRHAILTGLVTGLTWGVVMRLWMRFVSTDPQFTWSGTGFILGASTLVGLALGIGWVRRQAGGAGWWRAWGTTIVTLGGGAGAVMIPSVVLGAMAFGRTTWRPWIRVAFASVAVTIQVWIFVSADQGIAASRIVPAMIWYAAMISLEAFALSLVFRPSLDYSEQHDLTLATEQVGSQPAPTIG